MENSIQENHLAWHETLEIHELVAFQAVGLIRLKKAYSKVADSELQRLYQEVIEGITNNLRELLEYYPKAPVPESVGTFRQDETAFYAGDLLGLLKTSVRNYSIAITETATSDLRETLRNQLNNAILAHGKVFAFMYARSDYPSYDLEALLEGDVELASQAIDKSY
ncbi:spore coat protein [Alteribacter natronophilus]|uniref:spore coat protein n=1 Tax=Alteribacter natronophilus TaxID=2583810 RepID=UPI00110EA33E|nr:spore coat protein [Alteribacter natronophilus]TMW71412.1 spore coat protein [Alteribacter natronophilus]